MLVTYKSVLAFENMHTGIFRVDRALCLQPALRKVRKKLMGVGGRVYVCCGGAGVGNRANDTKHQLGNLIEGSV